MSETVMSESAEALLIEIRSGVGILTQRVEDLRQGMDSIRGLAERTSQAQADLKNEQSRQDERMRTMEREIAELKRLRESDRQESTANVAKLEKDHGERIGKIEQRMWTWGGAIAVVAGLATFFIQKLLVH